MTSSELFPPIEPNQTGVLDVGAGHRIYWEVSGNPEGAPVVFLHGGPGAGASADHRRFFDPVHYKIVVFDQRGAGRSEPLGSLEANTTQDLIGDIETLREKLKIDRWQVFGGSWGSTLALAYAEAYPERVTALVLRGIFLCRKKEIDWFLYGMGAVFPENWRRFAEFIPEAERGDLLSAYYKRLIDSDSSVHVPAAHAWSVYEGSCSTLLASAETVAAFDGARMALGLGRIEAHYFINNAFLGENALLEGLDRIRQIPAVIVQGRYDMVCPIQTADELHRAWPEAEYIVVPDAGHSAMEPGTRKALIAATEKFKALAH